LLSHSGTNCPESKKGLSNSAKIEKRVGRVTLNKYIVFGLVIKRRETEVHLRYKPTFLDTETFRGDMIACKRDRKNEIVIKIKKMVKLF
jgi:hypothetical protein